MIVQAVVERMELFEALTSGRDTRMRTQSGLPARTALYSAVSLLMSAAAQSSPGTAASSATHSALRQLAASSAEVRRKLAE